MFYNNSSNWVSTLIDNYILIQEELLNFLKNDSLDISAEYSDYVGSGKWQTIPLVFFTMKNPKFHDYFPVTLTLLQEVPELIGAEFSILNPNTSIKPHVGYSKEVMRTHLGLVVPEGDLGLKCEGEVQSWNEGSVLSFNDGCLHEAWNMSNSERLVLMVDTPIPKSNYTAKDIASYKLNNLEDKKLLKIASKQQWLDWFNNQEG